MDRNEAMVDQRKSFEWLKEQDPDEVKIIKAEIDPILEVGALNKAFDDYETVLFGHSGSDPRHSVLCVERRNRRRAGRTAYGPPAQRSEQPRLAQDDAGARVALGVDRPIRG